MSLDTTKCDPELGRKVHEHLVSIGLETPITDKLHQLTSKQKIEKIENHFTHIMEVLGLDLTDDSLIETPSRVAKMFVSEAFWGLNYENFPKVLLVDNKMHYDQMFIERDVTIMSKCEHHMVDFYGLAQCAYFPNSSNKVLGLSKFSRIAEFFARRPQVQERLTNQIAETLKFILGSDNVAVRIDSKHMCVSSRGVEDQNAFATSNFMDGSFRNDSSVRSEFLTLIGDPSAKLR
jgi:GTP cyclohydrolase IA